MGREEGPLLKKASPPNLLARLASPIPSKPFGWWGGGPVGVPLDGDGARCGRFLR